MTTTRVYVDPIRLRKGEPAIAVATSAPEVMFGKQVTIHGPSKLVQDEKGMPAPDGSKRPIHAWVETKANVSVDRVVS